ncbi:GGDEF domain-containing protein [Halomonas urumqiensis]|uniref:diguanylate cyclase n=1 Tax=Halomonas urumqiensis TaxID=1684789 RepID=A0A2N7UFR8_9GAMM|nr:sensor domain-containing diguanylate cyclase [Halomonas urumqiensis]PMR79274.1 GGDEF domain-containing protein [Halomonas urumqiensis]PTB03947.1 GGDEF domain-containing protein [Halomonas urumqiensis]GHE19801.1 hypothetical protein GCM10017767_03220 [Halomonas urumqiensis]
MTPSDVMPGRVDTNASTLAVLAERLPGVIFQLYRHDRSGQLCIPHLAGRGTHLLGLSPDELAIDARPALERLDKEDYPRLMAAIESSVRWMTPITAKFRLRLGNGRTVSVALRAHPSPAETGVLWHGMLMDISEQVAEEARLRKLSSTDDLTGAANRRKLMNRLDEEVSLSNRHATPLSLMILDLDHFKRVNDTWGHLRGDDVLRNLAILCKQTLREEDLVARLGGEEFALLLPLTPLAHCQAVAERLRQSIAEYDFGLGEGRVTVSIGIAEHRIGETRDMLIDRADRHLYAAKHAGRNRVMATTTRDTNPDLPGQPGRPGEQSLATK